MTLSPDEASRPPFTPAPAPALARAPGRMFITDALDERYRAA
ncbi:hypothetical protein [Streptomyces katsurahamanus]|nr:hypothetical protein [Streptomyces katsurahamanus]